MTTLISFYTPDWKYPHHAERLKRECEALGVPYKIEELKSTGSYLRNTCLKPQYILDCLKELKSPVLWVDVDASLLRREMFYIQADFAARPMSPDRDRTWHVGTMWFNYTPAMIEFLEKWIENTGNLSDESALEKTWQDHGFLIETCHLPPEFFYIERKARKPSEGTIIMHRISDSAMKRREMGLAKLKRELGVY